MNEKDIIRDLGDGLILRQATIEDAEALAKFNGEIHADEDEDFAEHIAQWVTDLATKPHPTFEVGNFTLVEDTKEGKIVSSLNLIPQTWSYGGIEFGVGRPELVGTKPDYRRRGLIRAQMEVVHLWSEAMGHKIQAITGIAWYYRMFGYEMALNLGGGRRAYGVHVPKLKEDAEEPCAFRAAEEKDLGFINDLYEAGAKRSLVTCKRDQTIWQYELSGRDEKNSHHQNLCMIETKDGEAIGFLAYSGELWGAGLPVTAFEVKAGVCWLDVVESAMRYLWGVGDAASKKKDKELTNLYFNLGEGHPVYEVIPDRLPRFNKPYAWYLRVADIPGFVQFITPVLEQRLAASPFVGYSGELTVSFYKNGLKLTFEQGKIKAEAWEPEHAEDGMLFFPDLTFLHLLFGYRDFDELDQAFADCFYKGNHLQTRPLIRTLFPRQASNVWPVA